jgi:ubiquinone/menaquinone biosynthesis C-methylase UbiE
LSVRASHAGVSQAAARALSNVFYRLPRKVRLPVERLWYTTISNLDRDGKVEFLNYGWADLDSAGEPLPLDPDDEPNRCCIQLYHHVASARDPTGLDVLEVGCGRGGGAWYVKRYLNPRSVTALDRTANAIAFCRAHYQGAADAPASLRFVQGDAEALPFGAASFDAVINIESSNLYSSMERFLEGVHRVLKPGGHLLYADLRPASKVQQLRHQFQDAGLSVLEEECITAHVLRALEQDDAGKKALIRARVPWVLRPFFNEFAALSGSRSIYGSLESGELVYLRFVLKR